MTILVDPLCTAMVLIVVVFGAPVFSMLQKNISTITPSEKHHRDYTDVHSRTPGRTEEFRRAVVSSAHTAQRATARRKQPRFVERAWHTTIGPPERNNGRSEMFGSGAFTLQCYCRYLNKGGRAASQAQAAPKESNRVTLYQVQEPLGSNTS